jgi:hypothetical protein
MPPVPCDTHLRERLAPVSPESLRPSCKSVFGQRQRGKALAEMGWLEGHYVLALDGPGSCSSKTIHGPSCLHQVHRTGSITSAHPMVGAALIPPDVRDVIPRMPEPMITPEGTEKAVAGRGGRVHMRRARR